MWTSSDRQTLTARLAAVFLSGLTALAGAARAAEETPQQLDRRFAALSADVYKRATSARLIRSAQVPDLPTLHRRVTELRDANDIVTAIALVRTHIRLVTADVDNPLVDDLVALLLQNNELNTAKEILAAARRGGDRFTISRVAYRFATYHFDRADWQVALEFLNGIPSDLKAEHSQHALVLSGIALQELKRHRESVRYYQQVPAGSPYYNHARLNMAVAYIRQDWWTDAQSALNDAINTGGARPGDEMQNRLYLVLGYLLLHKEYYRDAREAFRNITLDSSYANRALLGLGLSAGGQDDFPGALNALRVLQRRGAGDLSTDETFVLLPLVHQKLRRPALASAAYDEASAYYQAKLAVLEDLLKQEDFHSENPMPPDATPNLSVKGILLDLDNTLPPHVTANVRNLGRFKAAVDNSALLARIDALSHDYHRLYKRIVRTKLEQRRDALRSYLSQCRFGMAKLLDQNETRQ